MTELGVCILGRLPNGRLEGVHLDTPDDWQGRITAARDTGRYTEIFAAKVFQRVRVERTNESP